MATWTTAQDVLNRWIGGGAPLATSQTLLTLIDDAEDAVLEIFPRIQERIDSGELPLTRVIRVVAGVTIRAYRVGQEYRASFSEATGPFSQGASFNDGAGKSVHLTEDEIKTLSPDRTKKAMSISMAPRAHSHQAWWNGGDLD